MVAEGLSYGTREEYEFRFEIFRKKDKEVDFWNKIQSSFELGHNMFSTMTEEEAASEAAAGTGTGESATPSARSAAFFGRRLLAR